MKLRHIFTALAAAALAFVGCQQEEKFLEEVQVSKSLIGLPIEGGSEEITVTAADKWEITGIPEWLTVAPVSGEAGETVVKFSAEASEENKEAVLHLNCGVVSQVITVFQMAEKVEIPLSTCAEVNNNGVDGKVYRVKGTCTSIANTQYGNWYLTDDTGTVYIYGTLYNGATQQFTKLGLEVGDIVTVEGPRKNYNGTIELVDVTVIEIEKSLLKLEKMISTPLPLEGGVATALLTVKAGEFSVEIPEDASWLTAGEPTKVGDLTCVELTAAPNEGGARKTTVTFKTVVDGKEYIAPADIEQFGAIAAVTVADFLAAPEGTALYELTGIVKNLANTTYGNFDLVDATGSVYVYGLTNNGAIGSNDKKFAEIGINEGDVITIIGTRTSYKETPQVGGTAYLKEHVVAAKPATVTEFLAESKGTWCKVTGTIANLVNETYGNFDLVGEDGASVYVYGLTTSFVAKNDKSFANLGLKEGDIVTLVGKRDSYNDQDQVGGPAYYISHEAGAPAVDPWETAAVTVNGAEATDDARLKELRAYADADYLYVRLTAAKETPFAANYLDFYFTDGEGETAVWWGWTTTGTDIYYQEHKCELDAETGAITKMRWYIGEERVYIDDYTTETTDSEVVWTIKFPREYVDVYKSSTNTLRMSFILWNGWDAYWAIPARGGEMMEVTLP